MISKNKDFVAETYEKKEIGADFKIELVPLNIQLSDDDHRVIEQLWVKERQRRGALLFDGTVFNASHYDAMKMEGFWIPFRYVLASYRDRDLAEKLHIRPVAVSGITCAGDHILFGERGEQLVQHPGYLELAPSGSLAALDFRGAIVQELEEETGILADQLSSVEPFALMNETTGSVVEICLRLKLKTLPLDPPVSREGEYRTLHWVHRQELDLFLRAWRGKMVPLSLEILRACRLF